MFKFILAHLLLAFAALSATVSAAAAGTRGGGMAVVVRQVPPVAAPAGTAASPAAGAAAAAPAAAVPGTPSLIMSCADYSRIANLSTVGLNSTYRATFFIASPHGNQFNAEVLDTAIAKLPTVIMNGPLNAACGNLTAIAIQEAARNFTMRTVLQLSNIPVPPPLIVGPIIPIVCISIVLMCGTWVAMP